MSFDEISTSSSISYPINPSSFYLSAFVPINYKVFYTGIQTGTATQKHKNSNTSLIDEFNKHAEIWKLETEYLSAPSEKYLHPSYVRIIGLGTPALPFILSHIKKAPGDWFCALRAISGDNPVTDEMAGDLKKMTKSWLKWGAIKGLI